ncbi:hypothetical protein F5Y00DRAFT_272484 [Daldinia vernicosa]|uniref:uncharacterized protein n=1 Tax=Daldinia vernicosa TaxID=114800 RepID=UPI00200874E1|nr:uncharacterized protein F5Y00DRAFT_272484 [Daldinia vernicosa]KAI0852851.1 hypothetical protein F5Y00DRAFT_272484 [Daldinia vernicosa]
MSSSHDLEHNPDGMELQAPSREFEPRDIKLLKKFRGRVDEVSILKMFREFVERKEEVTTNREEYLRMKFREVYPKLYPSILEFVYGQGQGLAAPERIKEILEHYLQIVGGFHKDYFMSLRTPIFSARLVKFRNAPPTTSYPKTFHMFMKLPPELRGMIWEFAVWTQNRFVDTYRLRKIMSAPCPALFLTCKESRSWTTKLYKRVRNGDLLYGKIMPAARAARGPVISFECDIMKMGDWRHWNSPKHNYPKEVAELRSKELPLRPIHQRIEALSRWGFHRVVLERPHEVHPELIFYKNSRKHLTNYPQFGGYTGWSWDWTHSIEEVWTIDGIYNYLDHKIRRQVARVFPPVPGDDCICSLCERADTAVIVKLPYKKPHPLDFAEHERIFETIIPSSYWEDGPKDKAQGLHEY